MSTKFYYGQVDYIAKLNELDDAVSSVVGSGALLKSGGIMTGQLQTIPGTVGIPGISIGNTTSGFYSPGTNEVGLSAAGSSIWRTNLGTFIFDVPVDSGYSISSTEFIGPLTGNATTATTLQTARAISLSGDVTGGTSFDGSTGVTISATLASTGVVPGTYGSDTIIPRIEIDSKGRVISVATFGVAPPWASITGTPTTLTGYGITDAQPLDGDLTSIAALAGTSGLLRKTAANTWVLDTNTYLTSVTWGSITGTISAQTDLQSALDAKQPLDGDLTAIAAITGAGYLKRTGVDTWILDPGTGGGGGSVTLTGDVTGSGTGTVPTILNPSSSALAAREGGGSAALYSGGLLSINSGNNARLDITAMQAVFTDYTTPSGPTASISSFGPFSAIVVTGIATQPVTYIGINSAGSIQQSPTPFTATQRRTIIPLGIAIHTNNTVINATNQTAGTAGYTINQLQDLFEALGALNISGNAITANGANLNINRSAGTILRYGCNFPDDVTNPHQKSFASGSAITFRYRRQNSVETADTTNIAPSQYDNAGTLTSVGSSNFSVQRIYIFQSGLVRIQYGQAIYPTMATALSSISTENFTTEQNIAANGIAICYLAIKGNATDLSDPAQARFVNLSKFGATSGSAGTAFTSTDIINVLGYTPYNASNPAGYISGNQTITISGDAAGTGATAISLVLSNTGVSAASYGSATQVATFTVDSKGRLSAAGTATINIPFSAINTTPTTLAGYGITDAQTLDADLTAISAISSTGYLRRTGTNTWDVSDKIRAANYIDKTQVVTTSGSVALDMSLYDVFNITTSNNITFSTSNMPSLSGETFTFVVRVTQGATAYSVTWFGSIVWLTTGGAAPAAPAANKTVEYIFTTVNGTSFVGRKGASD